MKEQLGINAVYTGDKFKDFPLDLTKFTKLISDGLPDDVHKGRGDGDLSNLLALFKTKAALTDEKDQRFDVKAFHDITAKLREVKTPEEMYMIRKAMEISCMAHNEAMKTLRPDMSELEIQGLQEYVHKRYGSEEVGYGSIVGAGENGCILHYMVNNKTKVSSGLLLTEVGASYHSYSADVTRTVPANGKFSPKEKIIYQLVYDAQEAAFKTLKDGSNWADASNAARDVLANGLLKLGIIKKKEEVRKYYPHGLGHHIGLDVHDKSMYGPLKKNMVITIEPGIYIMPNSDCDKKWWGIGVRIEDDALNTENGYELLSAFAPRSIEAVEKMMVENSVIDNYKLPPLKTVQKKPFENKSRLRAAFVLNANNAFHFKKAFILSFAKNQLMLPCIRSHIFWCAALFALGSCREKSEVKGSGYTEDGFAAFSTDSLAQHVSAFSADSMLGRKPFTEGETKTVAWLQQQFAQAGLEPGNANSYLQEVPMVDIATKADSTMNVTGPKSSFSLKGFDDYVLWTEKTDSVVRLNGDELVFAGYGVNAPERGWNDYAGLNVKGKIVLVLVNDPGYGIDPSMFKGDTMTYYGRWTYKFEEAARQGAKGCLVIHNTKAAAGPFYVLQNNYWNGSRLHLDNRGKNVPYCDVVGWVSEPTTKRLLQAAGYDSTLLRKAATRGFKPVPLGISLTTSIAVKATYKSSHNIIGKITGAKHPDEYIIYSAHWDHIGVGKPDKKGDSIYNGAVDNASGTVGLLELARAFKSLKTAPDRSIVFLAVTAEEQGLWGSSYYAQNPVYPAAKTLADINIDGLNKVGPSKDIIIVGQGQSALEDTLRAAAERVGRTIAFEQHPEAGYYYRSDHFNFARIGIPSMFTNNGTNIIGKDAGYGKKMEDEYIEKIYHRPSDEYSRNWNLEGAIEDLKLLFMVGKRVANGEQKPTWKEGSEFKNLRKD